MHRLVRDLYKRVLVVGRDYPTGLSHVKKVWKRAILDKRNCPSCYKGILYNNTASEVSATKINDTIISTTTDSSKDNNATNNSECEEEILRAVHRGRLMVKEMEGIIQLKKYRTMKQRYSTK